jgi:phage FluMu protein Com
MDERTDWQWRCVECDALLGVEVRGQMHLKYKAAQYVVTGPVQAVCRRCATTNETNSPRVGARGESASG